jgi:hypothetical protein
MIKARVNHYNKINDKWQFVVKDVEFKDRKPLDKNRGKRGRPILWTVAGESYKRRGKMDLQILVYDDA